MTAVRGCQGPRETCLRVLQSAGSCLLDSRSDRCVQEAVPIFICAELLPAGLFRLVGFGVSGLDKSRRNEVRQPRLSGFG